MQSHAIGELKCNIFGIFAAPAWRFTAH